MIKSDNIFDTHDSIHFLDRVNKDLKEVVAIAETDFVEVNAVLREMYERNQKNSDHTKSEAQFKMEGMMIGLQYMDVLSQRVDHLVLTHQRMITNSNLKKWFFHLHVFQSMTIELDLLRSIDVIKTSLDELKNQLSECQNEESELFFTNTLKIKAALQKAIDAFAHAGGDTRHLPIPPLTAEQISALDSLYTMDRERIVLKWFLNSMPSGTWNDLVNYYESEVNIEGVDNTELF
jgi:hypothetical protein